MANANVQPPGISSKELIGLINSTKNRGLGHPGLVIGTGSAAKVKFTNDTDVTVKGLSFRIAAGTEVAFTATTDNITASAGAVQECVFLVIINESGTPSLQKGTVATGSGQAAIPSTTEGYACVGYVRVAVAAGATSFTATTDLLSAAHITDTYVDMTCNAADWGQ